jgi:hypothetical protein
MADFIVEHFLDVFGHESNFREKVGEQSGAGQPMENCGDANRMIILRGQQALPRCDGVKDSEREMGAGARPQLDGC